MSKEYTTSGVNKSVPERLRRKTILRINDDNKKESARRASQIAIERAWKICSINYNTNNNNEITTQHHQNNNNNNNLFLDDLYSVVSDDDASSYYPHNANTNNTIASGRTTNDNRTMESSERAILRGMKRGLRESNESILPKHHHSIGAAYDVLSHTGGFHYSEFDLATINENNTTTSNTSSKKKKKKRNKILNKLFWVGRMKNKNISIDDSDNNDDNDTSGGCDAWMCGVCGLAYASSTSCEAHESQHIMDVVTSMDWYNNSSTSFKTLRQRRTSVNNNNNNTNSTTNQYQYESVTTTNRTLHMLASAQKQQQQQQQQQPQIISPTDSTEARLAFQSSRDEEKLDENGYPGLDSDLPSGALIPKPRSRTSSNPPIGGPFYNTNEQQQQQQQQIAGTTGSAHPSQEDALLISDDMKEYVVLADEALYDVINKAQHMILTKVEYDAEYELAMLSRDKLYYDELSNRAAARRYDPSNRYRSDGHNLLGKVQNKLLDAYQLMKESDGKKGITDQYNRKMKRGIDGNDTKHIVIHTEQTLYVNVMVKNSVQVVRHELQRLAKQRWQQENQSFSSSSQNNDNNNQQQVQKKTQFERFRVYTQINIVKLAGIALASDFTPRRIAVQLSNDLYRLLTPKLKRRGVTIETEIEYRVGPYFVLAVNINTIEWRKLIFATHRDLVRRNARWAKEHANDDENLDPKKNFLCRKLDYIKGLLNISMFDVIAHTLSFLYHFHWLVYLPICWVAYNTFLGTSIRLFILAGVADEIFFYVEEKGMEMDIKVCRTETQASFMLSALREIRAEGQELKKKRQESESQEKGVILGPLMGPAIPADKNPPVIPDGFDVPENLEYIGLELDLPVGFQRMRWAFLSQRSKFITEALYKTEAKYENIVLGDWDKHAEHIGEPKLPDDVDPKDFIGAEKEGEYLMPKSAFVSANMCYETHYLIAYNDYCFCLKKRARNPDAPFGKTFIAWTQYTVVNTGANTCKLTCSVEAEFPSGEPMVARQIRSGMRAGTGELFVMIGETVAKYADEFP